MKETGLTRLARAYVAWTEGRRRPDSGLSLVELAALVAALQLAQATYFGLVDPVWASYALPLSQLVLATYMTSAITVTFVWPPSNSVWLPALAVRLAVYIGICAALAIGMIGRAAVGGPFVVALDALTCLALAGSFCAMFLAFVRIGSIRASWIDRIVFAPADEALELARVRRRIIETS